MSKKCCSLKKIDLRKLADEMSYCPESGVVSWKVQTGFAWIGKPVGNISRPSGYRTVMYQGKLLMVHRIAWYLYHGTTPGNFIDHINGVRHDNRLRNLRECTQAQNMQNRKMHSNNSSGHPGVCWNSQTGKWLAYLVVNGKSVLQKNFHSLDEAIAARKEAKARYHTFQPFDRMEEEDSAGTVAKASASGTLPEGFRMCIDSASSEVVVILSHAGSSTVLGIYQDREAAMLAVDAAQKMRELYK